jgi:hypothetical protein
VETDVRATGLLLLTLVLLAGCSAGPKKRVFPPEARLQQLELAEDGSWQLQLRLHNYSNVSMTFERVEAELQLGGQVAGTLRLTPAITVAASSVELLDVTLTPAPAAAGALQQALDGGSGVGYRLSGSITTSDPRGNYRFEFASRLDRVPGLDRVLR